jgi:hypothetical protein
LIKEHYGKEKLDYSSCPAWKPMRGFLNRTSKLSPDHSMTTIIGIFDNERHLDRAVDKLARAGFEDTVYDESIVTEEAPRGEPIAFALGHVPTPFWGSRKPAVPAKPDQSSVIRAFKAHLADYNLPDEVIEGYAITLHHSEFVLVKTQANRADQVMTIMKDCGAIRTDRHG